MPTSLDAVAVLLLEKIDVMVEMMLLVVDEELLSSLDDEDDDDDVDETLFFRLLKTLLTFCASVHVGATIIAAANANLTICFFILRSVYWCVSFRYFFRTPLVDLF